MAEGKKSVLLYCDLIHTVNKLPDETAGKLFKHFLAYINDLNPSTDDLLVEIAFEGVKQSLKRDLKKYELRAERSKKNGALGGRPKKTQDEPKEPSGLIENLDEPRKPDSVSVSVTDSVSVKVKDNVIKNNIVERENNFRLQSKEFNQYDSKMIEEFCDYWTEPTANKKKMLFETNKTFDISRRLARWNKNNFNKNNNGKPTVNNSKPGTEQVYQLNYKQNAQRDHDFIRSEQAKRKAERENRSN